MYLLRLSSKNGLCDFRSGYNITSWMGHLIYGILIKIIPNKPSSLKEFNILISSALFFW